MFLTQESEVISMTAPALTLASAAEDCMVGQRFTVTLPKLIRESLGIEVGDYLRFELGPEGNVAVRGMKLIPANSGLAALADNRVRQISKGDATLLGDLK